MEVWQIFPPLKGVNKVKGFLAGFKIFFALRRVYKVKEFSGGFKVDHLYKVCYAGLSFHKKDDLWNIIIVQNQQFEL